MRRSFAQEAPNSGDFSCCGVDEVLTPCIESFDDAASNKEVTLCTFTIARPFNSLNGLFGFQSLSSKISSNTLSRNPGNAVSKKSSLT